MPTGRPSKLTPALQTEIANLIKAGNYVETAAAASGISKDTLYAWLRKGARAKTGTYREFSDAIKAAMGNAEVSLLGVIARAAVGVKGGKPGQWQAAAWMLERMHPERFSQPMRARIENPEPPDFESESNGAAEALEKLNAKQLTRLMDVLAEMPTNEGETDTEH